MDIISEYDVVINGADNFPARYLVNDATYLNSKPLVDGSILMFDGQSTVFLPGRRKETRRCTTGDSLEYACLHLCKVLSELCWAEVLEEFFYGC